MQYSLKTLAAGVIFSALLIVTIQARLELKAERAKCRDELAKTIDYYGLSRIHGQAHYEHHTYGDWNCHTHLVRVDDALKYNVVVVQYDGVTQNESRTTIPLQGPEFVIDYPGKAPNRFHFHSTTGVKSAIKPGAVEVDDEETFWFETRGIVRQTKEGPFLHYFFVPPDKNHLKYPPRVEGLIRPLADKSVEGLKDACDVHQIKCVYFAFEEKQ